MTNLALWNSADMDNAASGLINPGDVRRQDVEALVDTGATTLVLPIDVCRRLGLRPFRTTQVELADGSLCEMTWVRGLWIEILGRGMSCDALAAPEGTTPLIGQIPLEGLDLVVDPRSREIRTNPEHPDGPLYYARRAA
ncbi:MAG TPA: clan AA aspartic protease [Polyangia bacterium]|nr:clan AA aspartic protease [Polyangia bacterium]